MHFERLLTTHIGAPIAATSKLRIADGHVYESTIDT